MRVCIKAELNSCGLSNHSQAMKFEAHHKHCLTMRCNLKKTSKNYNFFKTYLLML